MILYRSTSIITRAALLSSLSVSHGSTISSSSVTSTNLNSNMKQLIEAREYQKALDLFDKETHRSTDSTITLALKASTLSRSYEHGVRIHQRLSKHSSANPWIQTSLIHFYMQCNDVSSAEKIFDSIENKTIFMYGALFKGYITNDMTEKVIEAYKKMSMAADDVIHILLFNACAKHVTAESKQVGRDVLGQLPSNFHVKTQLANAAIDMLMKFGDVKEAEQLFASTKKKTLVTYGAMMQGYVDNGMSEKALYLFERIDGPSNDVIHAIVLTACASVRDERSMKLGNRLYRDLRNDQKNDIVLVGSMLNMLMKFGQVKEAEQLFFQIAQPAISIFGTMMNGYNEHGLSRSSWTLFEIIKKKGLKADDVVLFALIKATAQIGLRSLCQKVIDILPPHFTNEPKFSNALIDMWGKSMVVDEARKIFESIPQPNIYMHNTMINAYGRNGMGAEAVDLYWRVPLNMRDSITHVCVLNACSHAGLLDQARNIYQQINVKNDRIITTMVDCLSRMFMFDEAQQLVSEYEESHAPDMIMYTALLSGARTARESARAQALYDRMKSLFPNYKSQLIPASILLSNIYTSFGDQAHANGIRDHRLVNYGPKVQPGLTTTIVDSKLWEFKAHDSSNPRSPEIYAKVDEMMQKLKEHGYQADSSSVTRPLRDDESVEDVLCGHSEKLAIAFNLIQDPQPTVIELTKNLRICPDCHAATKLIAKIYKCDIFARDANRGHHFQQNGQCSCLDHF